MALTKSQRAALREMFGGMCAYCGKPLPEKGWHADHVEAILRKIKYGHDSDGNMTIKQIGCYKPENERSDNYFPSCAKCNIEKSAGSVEDFRRRLERKVEVLRRNNANWNHLERFGIVAIVKPKVIFHYELVAANTNG